MVLAVLAAVITIPLLLMIATCLLERVESSLVPRAERVVRPASPVRRLRLVPSTAASGVDDGTGLDAVDPDFDPDATAQLRRVS